MEKFYYGEDGKGKLVRDKLEEIITSEGHKLKSHHLSVQELSRAILNKIPEELSELVVASEGDDIEEEKKELADVSTLIDAYIAARGFEKDEIESIKAQKIAKRGGFEEGLVIEYVALNPEGKDYDFWLDHFRKNPDRYIEKND